jgi:hypothetical protein
MNLNRWLAAVFVLLALAGCAQVATEQGQPPYPLFARQRGNEPWA